MLDPSIALDAPLLESTAGGAHSRESKIIFSLLMCLGFAGVLGSFIDHRQLEQKRTIQEPIITMWSKTQAPARVCKNRCLQDKCKLTSTNHILEFGQSINQLVTNWVVVKENNGNYCCFLWLGRCSTCCAPVPDITTAKYDMESNDNASATSHTRSGHSAHTSSMYWRARVFAGTLCVACVMWALCALCAVWCIMWRRKAVPLSEGTGDQTKGTRVASSSVRGRANIAVDDGSSNGRPSVIPDFATVNRSGPLSSLMHLLRSLKLCVTTPSSKEDMSVHRGEEINILEKNTEDSLPITKSVSFHRSESEASAHSAVQPPPALPAVTQTLIFVDVDGVLNVGVKDGQKSHPISFNGTNLEKIKQLQKAGTDMQFSNTTSKLLAVSTRKAEGDETTYADLCQGSVEVADVFVKRLTDIIKASGKNTLTVLTSTWRLPKHENRLRILEEAMSVTLGAPFLFSYHTRLNEQNTPAGRLENIADFFAHHAENVKPGTLLRAIVLEDFHINPLGWSCRGKQMESPSDVEMFLNSLVPQDVNSTVKFCHTYDEWTTRDGLTVQVGSGITLKHFADTMTFLSHSGTGQTQVPWTRTVSSAGDGPTLHESPTWHRPVSN